MTLGRSDIEERFCSKIPRMRLILDKTFEI